MVRYRSKKDKQRNSSGNEIAERVACECGRDGIVTVHGEDGTVSRTCIGCGKPRTATRRVEAKPVQQPKPKQRKLTQAEQEAGRAKALAARMDREFLRRVGREP